MNPFSATQWIFGNEDLEESFRRLSRFGYDGIELAGEPYSTDLARVKDLLAKYNMSCTSICGIFTLERDLSTSNLEVRRKAIQYAKDCIDMAATLGASHLIVVPSPIGKLAPQTSYEEEWENSVLSVREVGEYALTKGVNIALEAVNRYETYLVNTMEKSTEFTQQVGVASVKLMADVFHMNIEERDICEALRLIAPNLIHVHIADNTREAAGMGQTDFLRIAKTLREIHYQGPITMEFLPRTSDPYKAMNTDAQKETFDAFAKQSISMMKGLLVEV